MASKRRLRIPFPVNGINRAMPDWASPPMTCTDAQNVRSRGTSKRLTGGERDGTDALFQNKAGTDTPGSPGKLITGAVLVERTFEAVVNPDGNIRVFDDRFGDDYPKLFNFGATFKTGTDFLGRWIMYAKDPVQPYAKGLPATGAYPNTPFAPARSSDSRAIGDELRVTSSPVSATLEYGMVRAFNTLNTMGLTIKILPAPFGRRGASTATGQGECTYIGPTARVSLDDAGNVCGFAHAFLDRAGVDEVRLRVDIYQGARLSTYTSDKTYRLSGLPGPSEFTIDLDASTNQSLRCRFKWEAESNGDGGTIDETFVVDSNQINAHTFRAQVAAVPAGIAVGQLVTGITSQAAARVISWINTATAKEIVLSQTTGFFVAGETIEFRASAPADPVIDSTTIPNAPLASANSRAGFHFKMRGTAVYRSIVRAQGSDLEPLPSTAVYSISGADADPNAGLWQVKLGWTAVDIVPGAAGINAFDAKNLAYTFGTNVATDAKPKWPCIDRSGSASVAGASVEPTLTGGSASTAAAMIGSRTNKTQFFIPSTHLDYDVKPDWATATAYTAGDVVKMAIGEPNEMLIYQALADHVSGATSKPGQGTGWSGVWKEICGKYDVELDLRDTDGTVDDSLGVVCCPNGFAGIIIPGT